MAKILTEPAVFYYGRSEEQMRARQRAITRARMAGERARTTFGLLLKRERDARSLPSTELAARSGIADASHIIALERRRRHPTLKTLVHLCQGLNARLVITKEGELRWEPDDE